MSYFVLAIPTIFLVYKYRYNILYNMVLEYDRFMGRTSNNVTLTCIGSGDGENTNYLKEENYQENIVDINSDILALKLYINGKTKRILLNKNFTGGVILVSVDLYNSGRPVQERIDITPEVNEFILDNTTVSLTNSDKDKLLWLNIINNKLNRKFDMNLDLEYNLMLADISTYRSSSMEIVVKDNDLKVVNHISKEKEKII